jgi:hypothetical protein
LADCSAQHQSAVFNCVSVRDVGCTECCRGDLLGLLLVVTGSDCLESRQRGRQNPLGTTTYPAADTFRVGSIDDNSILLGGALTGFQHTMAVGDSGSTKVDDPSAVSNIEPPTIPDWTDKDYISALAKLESLQRQVAQTRMGVRKIATGLAQVTQAKETPEAFILQYKQTSEQVVKDINELKTNWQNPNVAKLFRLYMETDRKCRTRGMFLWSANAALSSVHVPLYGWVEKEQQLEEEHAQSDDSTGELHLAGNSVTKPEDEQVILDLFQADFAKLEWESSSKDVLLVSLRCTGSILNLKIKRQSSPRTGASYTAQVDGQDKDLRDISTAIASRSRPGDLKHLLVCLLCMLVSMLILRIGTHTILSHLETGQVRHLQEDD